MSVKIPAPPLALDRTLYPRPSKRFPGPQPKPLLNLPDLAHTIDERFVTAYPHILPPLPIPPLTCPSIEETLILLACLLPQLWELCAQIRPSPPASNFPKSIQNFGCYFHLYAKVPG